jgi:hypothetical protein
MSKEQGTAPKKEAPQQKPQGEHAPKAAAPVKGGKGPTPMPDGCHSWGCKHKAQRFNFCDEHYDHFKFGLIKKTGEPVMDYEKKFEHYQAFVAKKKAAHKVA